VLAMGSKLHKVMRSWVRPEGIANGSVLIWALANTILLVDDTADELRGKYCGQIGRKIGAIAIF